MTPTPFQETAQQIARNKSYVVMSADSGEARSHGWWKNLVEKGAWGSAGAGRVGPPDDKAIAGIAKLFGTSEEQVAAMIAADWYGVHGDADLSPRVQRLAPALDNLDQHDFDLVESLIDRLNKA
jgi:hypothetical protein